MRGTVYLLIVIGMSVVLIIAIRLQQGQVANNQSGAIMTPHRTCVPAPHSSDIDIKGTNTPTPDEFGITPDEFGIPQTPGPTITPLPLSKVTDLAPELADRDKVYILVMRCEGTFELFLVSPSAAADISQVVPLQPGDIILDVVPPASLMGPPPKVLVATPTLTKTGTLPPYPPPATITPPYP